MRKIALYLVVIPGMIWGITILGLGVVHAVVHSLNYTTGQDTIIQARVVSSYNRQHCFNYGRAAGCSSANLVSGNCVVKNVCQALGLPAGTACTTLSTLNVESCVIYTLDSTGEDAMLQETANQTLVNIYQAGQGFSATDFRAGFKAANGTNQDTACVAAGQSAGCDGP